MDYPILSEAVSLDSSKERLFIGAYGFERRSLGWALLQGSLTSVLKNAIVFHYRPSKGRNLVRELKTRLDKLGAEKFITITHDVSLPHDTERVFEQSFQRFVTSAEEVVVDISAMTKLLILITLYKMQHYSGTLRIVYTEAEDYAPSQAEYEKSKQKMVFIAKYPSRGFEAIIRTKCLSSIRMQGQPVSVTAFTSFNEQLVRHVLGSLAPHRLLFINGRPPREEFGWRERATQEIHQQLVEEYSIDNPKESDGLLGRFASTLDYRQTVECIDEIHRQYGLYERIICAATGSKMQTVGLFFSKVAHPDIHIEYPTPDSYYVKGLSQGIRKTHEIVIPSFSTFVQFVRHGSQAIAAT